jgi:hypothetical protein
LDLFATIDHSPAKKVQESDQQTQKIAESVFLKDFFSLQARPSPKICLELNFRKKSEIMLQNLDCRPVKKVWKHQIDVNKNYIRLIE